MLSGMPRMLGVLAVGTTLFGASALSGQPAGASIAGSATLHLSGAGKGTLHEGAQGVCTDARNQGVDLIGLVGSIAGFKQAATWSLEVASSSTKAGTFKITAGGAPGGQLDPMPKHATVSESEAGLLNSVSGSYTVKKEKGTLNVTFGSGKKAIDVKGSWNCSS